MVLFWLILVLYLYFHMLEINRPFAPSSVPSVALFEWNAYITFTACLWKGWVSQEINRGCWGPCPTTAQVCGEKRQWPRFKVPWRWWPPQKQRECRGVGAKASVLGWGKDCVQGWGVMDLECLLGRDPSQAAFLFPFCSGSVSPLRCHTALGAPVTCSSPQASSCLVYFVSYL